MNGFLLIDKHEGITSASVVHKVRRLLGVKKAGHSGTLDPLATGMLVICLGRATRLAAFLNEFMKRYEAEIIFGHTSTTYDRYGHITPHDCVTVPTAAQVEEALVQFVGEIEQTPPVYSAIKHEGRRLYDYARKNIPIEPKPRTVHIKSIHVTNYVYPVLKISVTCSTGTYIRSLAHDVGEKLDCGAYIHNLRRSAIGKLNVSNAITLADLELTVQECGQNFEDLLNNDTFKRAFGQVECVLDLPVVYVSTDREASIDQGVPIRAIDLDKVDGNIRPRDLVALRNTDNRLLAVGRALYEADKLRLMNDETVIEYVRVM